MAISRKDPKGRKLREGDSWRNDGRYSYRFTDIKTGKRRTIYAQDLPELREKEKKIAKDMDDNILTDSAIKKMTLNTLFERYMATRELKESTRVNYLRIWDNRVKDEVGNIKVVQMLPSHIKAYYSKLSKAGYAHSTIKYINNMIFPALEMAVDDAIIRKNPAKGSISDYGRPAEERVALTISQQEKAHCFCEAEQYLQYLLSYAYDYDRYRVKVWRADWSYMERRRHESKTLECRPPAYLQELWRRLSIPYLYSKDGFGDSCDTYDAGSTESI